MLDLAGDALRLALVADREKHREFVAAGARAAGARRRALLERFGDRLQHAVTGGVAVEVVNPLEMVEIEEQQHRLRPYLQ